MPKLDHSLYPDLDGSDLPDELVKVEDQADYIHRLCSAWDFYGWPPEPEFLNELQDWHEALIGFPLLQSPAYCALCDYLEIPHEPPQPYPGKLTWELQDEQEGRDLDPCFFLI